MYGELGGVSGEMTDQGLCYVVSGDDVTERHSWPIGFRLIGERVFLEMPRAKDLVRTYPCSDYEYLFSGRSYDDGP